jgi:hypothetical protein
MIMQKVKKIIFSEKGMIIVNALFLLSLLVRNSGIIFIAYLAWITFLAFGIKNSSSKAVKIINSAFIIFAATMIIVNGCLLLNYL